MPANSIREKRDLLYILGLPNPTELLVRVAITGEVQVVAQGPLPLNRVAVPLQPADQFGDSRTYNLLEFAPIAWWRSSSTLLRAVENGWLYVDIPEAPPDIPESLPPFDCCDLALMKPTTPSVEGDMIAFDGNVWVNVTPGLAGQVLVSNGLNQVPSFQFGASGVTGSGSGGRVTLWDTPDVLTSDPGLLFDGTALTVVGRVQLGEAAVAGAAAGKAVLVNSNATHRLRLSNNNGAFSDVITRADLFSDVVAGVVSASGGGTTNFLRADGTWAAAGSGIGSSVTAGTTGSTLFIGPGPVLAQDNAHYFWDNTNKRLGIGTNTPSVQVDVVAAGAHANLRAKSDSTHAAFHSSDADGSIHFEYGAYGSAIGGTFLGISAASSAQIRADSVSALILGTTTSAPFIIGTNNVDRARFNADGAFALKEQAAPAAVSGFAALYADSTSHTLKLANNGGSFNNVLSGTGVSGQVAYFNGVTTETSNAGFLFDGASVVDVGKTGANGTLNLHRSSDGALAAQFALFPGTEFSYLSSTIDFVVFAAGLERTRVVASTSPFFRLKTSNATGLGLGDMSAPTAIAGEAGLYSDVSSHKLMASYNGDAFSQVVRAADVITWQSQYTVHTVTYAGSTPLDFAQPNYQTISLTGNITFTTLNLALGRSISLQIICDGTPRNFTFPGGWIFLGAAAPASIAAGKTAVLSLFSYGAADANVLAVYAVQP